VAVFSLLSKNATVPGALRAVVSARPKLLPGLLIHCLTRPVRSTLMYWLAAPTGTLMPLPAPALGGWFAAVTLPSAQAPLSPSTSIAPGAPTRFT